VITQSLPGDGPGVEIAAMITEATVQWLGDPMVRVAAKNVPIVQFWKNMFCLQPVILSGLLPR
jgi:pyruvate/2-oxoglutarate/acetoin dehydrogenase E1 component